MCAERLDSQHSVADFLSKRLLIAKRVQKWHEDRRLLSVRIDFKALDFFSVCRAILSNRVA